MATSFLKSFMEAVNPVVQGKLLKRHETLKVARLRGGCGLKQLQMPRQWNQPPKQALEGRSTWPEIVVVPQAMQEPSVDGENVLEVSGEEIPSMELADHIAVHRRIPVDGSWSRQITPTLNPVLASIDDSGFRRQAISFKMLNSSRKRQLSTSLLISHLMRSTLIRLSWSRRHLRPSKPLKAVLLSSKKR